MSNETNQDHNTMVFITSSEDLRSEDAVIEGWGKPLHYKAAAAYAVRLLWEGTKFYAEPRFPTIRFYDSNRYMMGETSRIGGIASEISGHDYAAARYIMQAVRNEKQRIREYCDEWLTPVQAEEELELQTGTVIRFINRNRDRMIEAGTAKVDGDSVLIRRGRAMHAWKARRYEHIADTNEYALIIDPSVRKPSVFHGYPLKQEVYDSIKDTDAGKYHTTTMEQGIPVVRILSSEITTLQSIRYIAKAYRDALGSR